MRFDLDREDLPNAWPEATFTHAAKRDELAHRFVVDAASLLGVERSGT